MPNATETIWQEINNNVAPHHLQQKQLKECQAGANWRAIGPTKVCADDQGYGRLNFIKFYPETGTPTKIYVGAADGGIWFKDLIGASSVWTPITDFNLSYNSGTIDISVLGVSDLLIKPGDPNIMYVATGDKERIGGNDELNPYSIGVLKTTNGGISWTRMNGLDGLQR